MTLKYLSPQLRKIVSATFLSLLYLVSHTALSAAASEKPNILFIFTDDQSYETVRHLGYPEVITPHMDRLARHGVAFTNAYNMGAWNGAVCIASRTSLNTGRAMWSANEVEPKLNELVEDGQFWSQILKRSGYETYMSGKWHVKADLGPLFQHIKNPRGGMPNQTDQGYNRPKENDTWTPYATEFGGFWEGGKHWSEVLADDAVEYLDAASKKEDPFFMYLAFSAPHDPRQAPEEYVNLYDKEAILVPADFLPEYPYKQEMGCYVMPNGMLQRDEKLGIFPRDHETVKLHRQEYYAAITHVDAQIGRILRSLEESGKADNTYVVFTSDHGLACGHHGLLGKQSMYEHSMKPPLIITGPGVPKNETRDAFVYMQDIMPTTLEFAGIEKPDYVDFNSLNEILHNKNSKSNYNSIYGAYKTDLQRMIRIEDYKLILYPQAKAYRLFDLSSDPEERNDLAHQGDTFTQISKDLFKELTELQIEMNDPLDLVSIYPVLADK